MIGTISQGRQNERPKKGEHMHSTQEPKKGERVSLLRAKKLSHAHPL
jgi:hypothetical protein